MNKQVHKVQLNLAKVGLNKGFTLIEIMIVVAILGILSAIAIPSYQESKMRANRTDGKSGLLREAARQESFYNSAIPPSYQAVASPGILSPDENYLITVTACASPGTISTCFIATGTPQGDQSNDTCANLSVSNVGIKTSSGGNSKECWQR